jgi:hypothetical protein
LRLFQPRADGRVFFRLAAFLAMPGSVEP